MSDTVYPDLERGRHTVKEGDMVRCRVTITRKWWQFWLPADWQEQRIYLVGPISTRPCGITPNVILEDGTMLMLNDEGVWCGIAK